RQAAIGLLEECRPAGMGAEAEGVQPSCQVIDDVEGVCANRAGRAEHDHGSAARIFRGKEAGGQSFLRTLGGWKTDCRTSSVGRAAPAAAEEGILVGLR